MTHYDTIIYFSNVTYSNNNITMLSYSNMHCNQVASQI